VEIDASRFPRTAAYVAALPGGLDSFPECRVIGDAVENLVAALAGLKDAVGVPPVIRQILRGSAVPAWCSEVHSNAMLHLLRDAVHPGDDEFLRWAYDDSRLVFKRPAYRVLMAVLSPSLVVLGAANRWSTFHQGTRLTAHRTAVEGNGRMGTRATLTYPSHLFSTLVLRRQQQAFLAAIDAAGAKQATVALEERGPSEAMFVASWAG
jgi:hypothetical protein